MLESFAMTLIVVLELESWLILFMKELIINYLEAEAFMFLLPQFSHEVIIIMQLEKNYTQVYVQHAMRSKRIMLTELDRNL